MNEYQDYFKKIGKAQAWILGWLVSDGHIRKIQDIIEINLQIKDDYILHRMSKEFPGTKVTYIKGRNSCRLMIYGKEIVKDVINIGIPRGKKSDIVKPLNLPIHVMNDFWRGVFEGDGSIGMWMSGVKRRPCIKLAGSYDMCLGFKGILKTTNIVSSNGHGKITKEMKIAGHNINYWMELYNYFYDTETLESGLYLQRKHDKFKEIFRHLNT